MDNKTPLACCFTGYRPSKLPFVSVGNNSQLTAVKQKLYDTLSELILKGYKSFYTGMAMGFDIIAAEVVLMLQAEHPEIELIAVMPHRHQDNSYSPEWKARFDAVLAAADSVVCLSEEYHRGCFQKRNEYMVDRSQTVVTWFDGRTGGTANTVYYARKKKTPIINICPDYSAQQSFDI